MSSSSIQVSHSKCIHTRFQEADILVNFDVIGLFTSRPVTKAFQTFFRAIAGHNTQSLKERPHHLYLIPC